MLWNYGTKGIEVSAVVSAAGTFLTGLLGGWDRMIQALILCMAVDFLLGILCGVKTQSLDSRVMFWGGLNKLLVLVFVGLACVLDSVAGVPEPYIRTAVIWFYISREGLSIIENYGKMGLKLPEFIKALLEQLKDKGNYGEENGHDV